MGKRLFFAALLAALCCAALAREGRGDAPSVAVLPFSGGSGGQGEAIAALLSARPELRAAFEVIPIPESALPAVSEGLFRMGAFSDSDILGEIGREIGADFVVWGHMRRLGRNRSLVMAAAICSRTLELAGGYHRAHRSPFELGGFAPGMASALALAAARHGAREPGSAPLLASAPLGISAEALAAVEPRRAQGIPPAQDGAEQERDLQTLAQVLAIEIANSGEYAVLPRASAMQDALREWEIRATDDRALAMDRLVAALIGIIDSPGEDAGEAGEEIGAAEALARAAGAGLLLSLGKRSIGGEIEVSAALLRAEDASPARGAVRGFSGIAAGVALMPELAILLADPPDAGERIAAAARRRRRAAMLGDPARFWSVGAYAGTSFAEPWLIGSLQGTAAPLPFSLLRVGFDAGFLGDGSVAGAGYFSMYPFARAEAFLPFALTPLPLSGGGVFAGAGGGFMMARYTFYGLPEERRAFLADFAAGANIADRVSVSYSLRTDFSRLNGKLALGFTHRFRLRERPLAD